MTVKKLRIKFEVEPDMESRVKADAAQLEILRQLQEAGHQIVVVIADYTAKLKAGGTLSEGQIIHWAEGFQNRLFKVLDREKTEVYFNGEWMELLNIREWMELQTGNHPFQGIAEYDTLMVHADMEIKNPTCLGRILMLDKNPE